MRVKCQTSKSLSEHCYLQYFKTWNEKTGVDISQSLTDNVTKSNKIEDHLSLINFHNDKNPMNMLNNLSLQHLPGKLEFVNKPSNVGDIFWSMDPEDFKTISHRMVYLFDF